MSFVTALSCRECGRTFPLEALNACDYCFGPLEATYDYEAIAAAPIRAQITSGPPTIWRYRALLPVDDVRPVELGAGWTPLVRAERLAAELGLGELWLKDDTVNPTGSFKDRVVSVALTKARQLGFKVAACASTGNLAASVAAHAARAGMGSVVLVPRDLERAKLAMAAVYGATVVAVDGNYDDVNRLCAELAAEHGSWAFANVNLRAYYAEGSKTLAFEIAEQLGWRAPDHVIVPVASGSQLTKVAKGFAELRAVGLLGGGGGGGGDGGGGGRGDGGGGGRGDAAGAGAPGAPGVRISGAQAEGCAPVATAFARGADDVVPVRPSTIARSLAIGDPADGYYALKTVHLSGGAVGSVSDPEILDAIGLLARTEGIFAETAGGVTIATLAKLAAAGVVRRDERVVAIVSGHGLKTVEALGETAGPAVTVAPTLRAFEAAVGDDGEVLR
ncbi:MAG TPA: threonine synthase [Acidimicrobiales bacterium]|nr:threonine synthase [Acidimicrobiales bacterium]